MTSNPFSCTVIPHSVVFSCHFTSLLLTTPACFSLVRLWLVNPLLAPGRLDDLHSLPPAFGSLLPPAPVVSRYIQCSYVILQHRSLPHVLEVICSFFLMRPRKWERLSSSATSFPSFSHLLLFLPASHSPVGSPLISFVFSTWGPFSPRHGNVSLFYHLPLGPDSFPCFHNVSGAGRRTCNCLSLAFFPLHIVLPLTTHLFPSRQLCFHLDNSQKISSNLPTTF